MTQLHILEPLRATHVHIQVRGTLDVFRGSQHLRAIIKTKEYGGLLNHIDPDLIKWFGHRKYNLSTRTTGQLYRSVQHQTHADILQYARDQTIMQRYSVGDACALVNQIINSGILNVGTGATIYLQEQYEQANHQLYICTRAESWFDLVIGRVDKEAGINKNDFILLSHTKSRDDDRSVTQNNHYHRS